ncbi:MAG: B-box zinc finger protein [Candidatus Bathyarchaeia archaeon]
MRSCEICLRNQAKYVCEQCNKLVCEVCFNPSLWVCIRCEKERVPLTVEQASSFNLFKFIFLGFMLIFIGMLIMFFSALFTGLSGNFILFFGPIPFILSIGKNSFYSLVFIIFIILTFALLLLFMFRKIF